jgi:hypothetical protein
MTLIAPDLDVLMESFHAGYLDSPDPTTLPIGATPDARNELFVRVLAPEDGGPIAKLRKREGTTLLNATALAAGRSVDGLAAWPRETGPEELLAVCNGILERWNGFDDFVAITGGGVFTPGARVHTLPFKNNLLVMDGHANRRYDGARCWEVGTDKPTTAPGLTAGIAPGVTGTYQGYVVWYDSVMDHEGSPSDATTEVVFTNQQRVWAKPSGAPETNYDFWRIYVRRTDTSEVSYFRVATVAIAAATHAEAVSDAARRDLGPTDNANDRPPAFAFAEEFKGYRIGVTLDSSDIWISKQFDFESQHPKDRFPVGGKGDTKPVRSVRKYGTECLIRKPTKTYYLTGDRVPFKIDPIDNSLGGVAQKSGIDVDGWWYDWDEVRGPYRTNTVQWVPIADNRTARIVATVNRQALTAIECEHDKTRNLIIWKVPVGGSTRCRLLLKYHYTLQRWLAPDTGFEYTALAQFTTQAGEYGVYVGDEWGRVYQLYRGEVDGVPSGTIEATITGATSSTVTAAAAAYYTTGNGLAGMPALVVDPSGNEQWVRIASNTGTVLTLDVVNGPALGPVPVAGWTVIVGAIDWYHWTSWLTGGTTLIAKSAGWFYLRGGTNSAAHAIAIRLRINRQSTTLRTYSFTFEPQGGVWGSGLWGAATWGESATPSERKHRMPRSFFSAQFRFSNYYPNQPVEIDGFRLTADWLRRRQVKSA